MSRIGKKPIKLSKDVKIKIKDNKISVSGKKGELHYFLLPGINVELKEEYLYVTRKDDSKKQRAFHGLTRSLINNMVEGVNKGFEKVLQIIGTGYSAQLYGKLLKLNLGFSHEILFEIPEDIQVEAKTIPRREQGKLGVQSVIRINGISKEDVGKFAAEIRKCLPPENYKGKGIRYEGEYVQIKAGKAGAA